MATKGACASDQDSFTCLICGQEGMSETKMRSHVLLEHVETGVCCPFCDLSGITSDEMTVHINAVHFDDLMSPTENVCKMDKNKVESGMLKVGEPVRSSSHDRKKAAANVRNKTLKHSQSMDHTSLPLVSSESSVSDMKPSFSENNLSRARLQLSLPSVLSVGASCGSDLSASIEEEGACGGISPGLNGHVQTEVSERSNSRTSSRSSSATSRTIIPDINDNVETDINSNIPAEFSCPLCQYITSSENLIQTHVNTAHIDVLSPDRGAHSSSTKTHSSQFPKPSTSQSCSSSIAKSVKNSDMDIDQYLCPICALVFYNTNDLNLHVNSEHSNIFSPNKSPRKKSAVNGVPACDLGCPVCGMEFKDKNRLQLHVNGHFSAEQTPVQEKTDKLIAQELENKQREDAFREQKEFHALQAMYGMADGTTYKRQYERNLEKAVAKGDLTVTEYHQKKVGLKKFDTRGIDDGHSSTKGIIQRLKEYYRTPTSGVARHWLCTNVDHYAASYGDKGWGCGYRNFQMLLSSLASDAAYCRAVFNDKSLIPSIPKIQQLIEAAWHKGFDKQGCEQLGGTVFNTSKWIGATEIVATLASLKVRCRLLDFHHPSGPANTHPRLFEWVKEYFEKPQGFKPPLYLQHQGHSRTIVGIEELKDKSLRLLIFDPSTSKKQMNLFHSIVNANMMRMLRRPLTGLKAKQYQIVAVVGLMEEKECGNYKVLQSERLS